MLSLSSPFTFEAIPMLTNKPYITFFYDVKPFIMTEGSMLCLTHFSGVGSNFVFESTKNFNVDYKNLHKALQPQNSFQNFDTSLYKKIMINGQERSLAIPNEKWYSAKPLEVDDLQNLSKTISDIIQAFDVLNLNVFLNLQFYVDDSNDELQSIYDECKNSLGPEVFIAELSYDLSNRDAYSNNLKHCVTLEPRNSQHPVYLKAVAKNIADAKKRQKEYEDSQKSE